MPETLGRNDSVRTEASRSYTGNVAVAELTHVGSLLADPTRSALLVVLMDGRARTGGELARLLGVAPSTVSEHVSRLLDADYVAVEAQGRHRYVRLAGPHIAELLETLGALEVPRTSATRIGASTPSELLHLRSCYDHLAGRLGVRIYDQMLAHNHLQHDADHITLTPSGASLLADLGVDIEASRGSRRPLARPCLDWSERRHHLAGAAGAGLFQALLDNGWIIRGTRPRSIRITQNGQTGLERAFNL